jgi:acyl-CoA hydrolase
LTNNPPASVDPFATKEGKPVRVSQVVTTQLVLPNDTNQLGNLLGGTLMHWMDITAAIAAQRHAGCVCVTASVDELNFHNPIRLGEVVTLQASVNRTFTTSMEVGVIVTGHGKDGISSRRANNAYLTFVAIDESGHPRPVVPVIPESDEERRRYGEALERRQLRLQRRQV